MIDKGINNENIKYSNLGLVLKYISTGTANSRTQITSLIGLSKMTASNIVNKLIKLGLVNKYNDRSEAQVGRTPSTLVFSETAPKILGIYVSRNKAEIAIFDMYCNMLACESCVFSQETAETITDKIINSAKNIIDSTGITPAIAGIASIGPINRQTGEILKTVNFFGIESIGITKSISKAFNIPAYLFKDNDAAAMAEMYYGKYPEKNNFVYVGITEGIGSGIISDGKLVKRATGSAGEIGHTTIDYKGIPCPCGRHGCLETYVKISAINANLKQALNLTEIAHEDYAKLAYQPEADLIFKDVAEKLASVFCDLSNALDTNLFILGHEGVYIHEKYIRYIEQIINETRFSKTGKTKVEFSSFLTKAPVYGSCASILDMFFTGDLLLEDFV